MGCELTSISVRATEQREESWKYFIYENYATKITESLQLTKTREETVLKIDRG